MCLAWTVWPLGAGNPQVRLDQNEQTPPEHTPARTDATADLNLAAFAAPLWVDPPEQVVAKPEAPPPPPPPLRVQLIAILVAQPIDGQHRAVLYDPDADKLVTVAAGDSITGGEVAAIDTAGVTLRSKAGNQRLDLRSNQDRWIPGATAAEDLAALMGRPSRGTSPATPEPAARSGAGVGVGASGARP